MSELPAQDRIPDGFPGQRMVVLPRPVVARAISDQLPASLIPSDIGYFPRAKCHCFQRPNGSPQVILILCVQGEGWVKLDSGEYRVLPGHSLVIGPNQPHAYGADARRPWSIYWCHAAGAVASRFAKILLGQNTSPVFEISDYPRLVALFTEMLDEVEQGYSLDHLLPASAALSHLLGLVYKLSRIQRDSGTNSMLRVRQVADYLQQLPEKPVSVSALAAMANLSKSHFCELFKLVTGFAPIDYLLQMRVQRACGLLDTTDQQIKRIASEIGFSDALYFSRVFRKVHGLSPRAYRSMAKG